MSQWNVHRTNWLRIWLKTNTTFIANYKVVVVTIAVVISTMQEKICIYAHNTIHGNLKQKHQNSAIHIARYHNDEILIDAIF